MQREDARQEEATVECNALDRWLASPARSVAFDDLPPLWRHIVVEIRCRRPDGLDDRIELVNKIRGAFGRDLERGASPAARDRRPCPWEPPCALDVLCRHRAIPGVGGGVQPPYTLAARSDGPWLVVTLILFGMADSCAAEAADALVGGLRNGLDLDRHRTVALEPEERRMTRHPGIATVMPDSPSVILDFLTPAAPRDDGAVAKRAGAILRGMFNRILGMARWYGLDVAAGFEDWLQPRLEAVRFDASGMSKPEGHFRRSASGDEYDIIGRTGPLVLHGDWRPLWPLLTIGELVRGGRATKGYGRYRVVGCAGATGSDSSRCQPHP